MFHRGALTVLGTELMRLSKVLNLTYKGLNFTSVFLKFPKHDIFLEGGAVHGAEWLPLVFH